MVLAHSGAPSQEGDGTNASGQVVDEVRQMSDAVDVVVAGHSHTQINLRVPNRAGGGHKLVVESLSYGTAFDQVDLTVDRASGDVVAKKARIPRTRHERARPRPRGGGACSPGYRERLRPLAARVVGRAAAPLSAAAGLGPHRRRGPARLREGGPGAGGRRQLPRADRRRADHLRGAVRHPGIRPPARPHGARRQAAFDHARLEAGAGALQGGRPATSNPGAPTRSSRTCCSRTAGPSPPCGGRRARERARLAGGGAHGVRRDAPRYRSSPGPAVRVEAGEREPLSVSSRLRPRQPAHTRGIDRIVVFGRRRIAFDEANVDGPELPQRRA